MKRAVIAALVVFVVAGTTAVYAQHWPGRWHGMWRHSTDDVSAFADARIAAVKAGLRLTPDQERLWPPVEAAARDLARQRIGQIGERREAWRDGRGSRSPDEMFDRFKRRADGMAASAAGMQRLAEAAEPLYRTLSEDQKRRLVTLASPHAGMRWRDHWGDRHSRWRERTGLEEPFSHEQYREGRDQQREPRRESGRI
jgi:hypothetical protein